MRTDSTVLEEDGLEKPVDLPYTDSYNPHMKHINEGRVREMVRIAVIAEGSQKAFARRVGLSEQYLVDVLKERRAIPTKILEFLGLERVISYKRADGGRL